MMEPLEFDFFTETPIDFESKKYKLLHYLMKCDQAYLRLEFSPWLLSNERFYIDASNYLDNFKTIKDNLTNGEFKYSDRSIFFHYEEPETLKELEDIGRLIRYAKPKIWKSNMYGKELAKDAGMFLW